jgi:hypothetical protein
MVNADTDRNDLQREIGALTARVERLESLRQRFVDTGPSLGRIGADIAVIFFVVVHLMGFDERLDGMDARLPRIEDGPGTLLVR